MPGKKAYYSPIIHQRVKEELHKKKVTVRRLASILCCSKTKADSILYGNNPITAEELREISIFCKVNPLYFLDLSECDIDPQEEEK